MHQIGGAENPPEEDANARALASPNHCKMLTTAILQELEWCKRSLKCIRTKYNNAFYFLSTLKNNYLCTFTKVILKMA